MQPMHPELRQGLAEERIRRLAAEWAPAPVGRARRAAAGLLLAASRRLAAEPHPAASAVERLVDEPVRELVVLAADGRVGHRAQLAGQSRCFE